MTRDEDNSLSYNSRPFALNVLQSLILIDWVNNKACEARETIEVITARVKRLHHKSTYQMIGKKSFTVKQTSNLALIQNFSQTQTTSLLWQQKKNLKNIGSAVFYPSLTVKPPSHHTYKDIFMPWGLMCKKDALTLWLIEKTSLQQR